MSVVLDFVMLGHVPIGCVLPYAGPLAATDTTQSNLDQIRWQLFRQGWLYCDGAAYSRRDYWELYGVIGNAYGGHGKHFNVPDLRGCFMRGVNGDADASRGDPSADQRVASDSGGTGNTGNRVGSRQEDAFQAHEHYYQAPQAPTTAQPPGSEAYMPPLVQQTTSGQATDSSLAGNGAPRVDVETRPINIYFNFIIRYR